MTNCKPIDYDALCDELLRHYLDPEYYLATKAPINCVTSEVTATAIDEYIKLLTEGYINVEIREELDKYITELLENDWFHQWPLVRLEYASRSLRRKTEVNYQKNKKREENIDREIELLDSLAKEGWPNAMAKIGAHYYVYGGSPKHNYESCVCLWIYSIRKGYLAAGEYLYSVFITGKYEQLCEELQIIFLKEVSTWFLEKHNATLDDYIDKLDKPELENYKKMCKGLEKLQKAVSERLYMRETVGKLFWPNGDSPYEIKY